MPGRYKMMMTLLISAIIVVGALGYKYIYLDIQIRNSNKSLYASADYLGFSLDPIPMQSLVLSYSDEEIIIAPATLKTWYESYVRSYNGQASIRPSATTITSYLKQLSAKTDTPPVNAKLDYHDGKIIEFAFPQPGHVLDIEGSYSNIANAMAKKQPSAELAFKDSEPEITLDNIDNLGIKKLLGRGESNFGGSSPSSPARITNIKVSSRLFNDILIKPGEEFSFNKILGDVDAVHGYLPELVIKNGGVVKELGGGICQVATTVFRAAVQSGLKITERHNHAFPVGHYNPQGFDATIYPGSADLRFINDTPNNILVQTSIKGTKIYFDFYGDDDRQVTVHAPVQYDIQTNGAMKAYLDREITYADGTSKKETFRSNYRSPNLYPTLRNPLE